LFFLAAIGITPNGFEASDMYEFGAIQTFRDFTLYPNPVMELV
jgi:hypothetical protein